VDTLRLDLRHALRSLARSPGFALVSVLTLGLGIGAATGVFTAMHAVLLASMPYPDPDRLTFAVATFKDSQTGLSAHDFLDYRDRATSFRSLGALVHFTLAMPSTGGDRPETLDATYVSTELFGTLGVAPQLGRAFSAEDGEPAPVVGPTESPRLPPVAIISHALWQRRFAASPAAIGSTLTLRGEPVTVVGIMPPGFRFFVDVDVWLPLRLNGQLATARRFHNWVAVGRLEPGVTLGQAQAEMSAIARRLEAEYPDSNTDMGIRLSGLHDALVTRLRPQVLLITAAVGLMLFIACGNVANLLLARAVTRRSELAMRVSLGASRRRLVAQLVTESTVLALLGGAVGVGVAAALLGPISTVLSFGGRPLGVTSLHFEPGTLAFGLGLSLLTGVAVGIVPSLRATRVSLSEELKGATRSATSRGGARLRLALVAAQVSLSLLLLVGSALLIRSFAKLVNADLGFDPDGVLTAGLALPSDRTAEELVQFYVGVLDEVRAIPGVQGAGMVSQLPVLHAGGSTEIWAPERPGERSFSQQALGRVVLPGYFEAMRMPLVAGRDLCESDRVDAPPVIVISEAVARRLFPGESPIGRRIASDLGGDEPALLEVVGVVGDQRLDDLEDGPSSVMYFPYHQLQAPAMHLAIRSTADAQGIARALREIVWRRNKDIPVADLTLLDSAIRRSTITHQALAGTVASFSALALLLAAIGLFGVLSYQVGQREHEIGIRMALGASRKRILGTVLRQGLTVTAVGLGAGAAVGLALTRLMRSLLYEVEPTDPASLAVAALLLLAVSLAACIGPAWRATRVQPVRALRWD